MVKALDLFQAYSQNKLPNEGGYIVSSFLDENSTYSRYEIVSYNGLKSIYLTEDGLTFLSDGNKLFILIEPPSYPQKHLEPYVRTLSEQIPHRFSELNIMTAKNQTKIMVSLNPVMVYSSFTILKPTGINFAFIFYKQDEILDTLKLFFEKTLNNESKIPQNDAKQAATLIAKGVEEFTVSQ